MWIFIGDEYRGLFARWQSNFRAIWLNTSVQQYQFSIHWWEWHYFIRHDMAFSQSPRHTVGLNIKNCQILDWKNCEIGRSCNDLTNFEYCRKRKLYKFAETCMEKPIFGGFLPFGITVQRYRLQRLLQITFHGKTRQMGTRPRSWRKDWRKGNVVILVPVYAAFPIRIQINKKKAIRILPTMNGTVSPIMKKGLTQRQRLCHPSPTHPHDISYEQQCFLRMVHIMEVSAFFFTFLACYGTIYLDFW